MKKVATVVIVIGVLLELLLFAGGTPFKNITTQDCIFSTAILTMVLAIMFLYAEGCGPFKKSNVPLDGHSPCPSCGSTRTGLDHFQRYGRNCGEDAQKQGFVTKHCLDCDMTYTEIFTRTQLERGMRSSDWGTKTFEEAQEFCYPKLGEDFPPPEVEGEHHEDDV